MVDCRTVYQPTQDSFFHSLACFVQLLEIFPHIGGLTLEFWGISVSNPCVVNSSVSVCKCTCMCVCSAALLTALVILVPVLQGSLLVGQLRSRSPLPWSDRRAVTSTTRPLAESAGLFSCKHTIFFFLVQWLRTTHTHWKNHLHVHACWNPHTN